MGGLISTNDLLAERSSLALMEMGDDAPTVGAVLTALVPCTARPNVEEPQRARRLVQNEEKINPRSLFNFVFHNR